MSRSLATEPMDHDAFVSDISSVPDKGRIYQNARQFKMVSRKSLLLKQAAYVSLSYGLLLLYGLDVISTGMMIALMSLFYLRLFNVLHQKAHANNKDNIRPLWLDKSIELINIYYLPYHESSSGKLSKHELHHKAHRLHANPVMRDDLRRNPHAVFERYGFLRSWLAALFYEEVMLYLDIRDRGISKDRWMTMAASTLTMFAMIDFLGWHKFVMFAIFYRLAFALSWFNFSYTFHHTSIYGKRIEAIVPERILALFRSLVGSGAVNSIFYHEHHHLVPQVPAEHLHKLVPYHGRILTKARRLST